MVQPVFRRKEGPRACAVAPPAGQAVHTNREDALVVWDDARHLEHFVRSAQFDTSAKSFGFLVPTPSKPTIAEANEHVVDVLAALTAPDVVHETRYVAEPIGLTMIPFALVGARKAAAPVAASAVRVLEETVVAGLDAVVLEADDPSALGDWLHAHDFPFTNALQRWVAPYLAKKWKITAFKYARPDVAANVAMASEPIASRAVRLSFSTDVPVYPYREPDDVAPLSGRELRLFLLASEKLTGAFDDGAGAWPVDAPFGAEVGALATLSATLPGVEMPTTPWLTELTDHAAQRHAADVEFHPAPDRTEVRRPAVHTVEDHPVPIPYELPFVVGGVWWWRRRRKMR